MSLSQALNQFAQNLGRYQQVTTAGSPAATRSSIHAAMVSSQGQRSSSVSGCPAAIEMVAHSDHANESDQAISHIAGTEA